MLFSWKASWTLLQVFPSRVTVIIKAITCTSTKSFRLKARISTGYIRTLRSASWRQPPTTSLRLCSRCNHVTPVAGKVEEVLVRRRWVMLGKHIHNRKSQFNVFLLYTLRHEYKLFFGYFALSCGHQAYWVLHLLRSRVLCPQCLQFFLRLYRKLFKIVIVWKVSATIFHIFFSHFFIRLYQVLFSFHTALFCDNCLTVAGKRTDICFLSQL